MKQCTQIITQISEFDVKSVLSETITTKDNKHCYYVNGGGLDTESTTIYEDITKGNKTITKVKYCFCYMYQVSIGNHIFLMRTRNELIELIDRIIYFTADDKVTIKGKKKDKELKPHLILWCANFAHEYSFLKNDLSNNYECTNSFCKDKRNILYYEIANTIEIRECIGLFGYSLDNIAKQCCITQKLKADLDYNLIRTSITPLTPREMQYCINDVAILSELHQHAIDKFIVNGDGIPYTKTGIVRKECKNNIYKIGIETNRIKKFMPELDEYQMIRRYGYNGGWCGSNPNFITQLLHNVRCADLTSDYPAQLLHRHYPYGEIKEIEDENEIEEIILNNKNREYTDKAYKYYYMYIAFEEIESLTEHGCINIDKVVNKKEFEKTAEIINGKVIKGKNIELYLNNVDIDSINMLYEYHGITIYKFWLFTEHKKVDKHVQKICIKYYRLKQVLKEELKQIEKEYGKESAEYKEKNKEYKNAKEMLNSIYGMTATKLYDVNYKYSNDNKSIIADFRNPSYDELWLSPFIAMFCTSYARQVLIIFISKYPRLIVQYDTDSLYYLMTDNYKELEKDIADYNIYIQKINKLLFDKEYEIFKDLGTWDIDDFSYEYFMCLGSKKYIKTHNGYTETVIAGLPKDSFTEMIKEQNISIRKLYHDLKNLINGDIIILNKYCHKLASAYNDTDEFEMVRITDYNGKEYIQDITSYHALIEIDFTLSIAETLLYNCFVKLHHVI